MIALLIPFLLDTNYPKIQTDTEPPEPQVYKEWSIRNRGRWEGLIYTSYHLWWGDESGFILRYTIGKRKRIRGKKDKEVK